MTPKAWNWSATGKPRVIVGTVLGTLGCMAVAFFVDSFSFATKSPDELLTAYLVNIFVPLCLAGPLLFFFSSKLRELAIANAKMTVLASTDSLTAVLNRGAFTMLVEAYLNDARVQERSVQGALLVIDADHFKAINDNYGHHLGDEALKIIARSIKGVLRSADLVGRIGGEEFGVFLPGASVEQAATAAERIRVSVNVAELLPPDRNDRVPLSVSVGGATFTRPVDFAELFKLADRRMYDAKQRGRNRVTLSAMGPMTAAA